MPEIQIRPVKENDIETLVTFEHDYVSDYVWQMDIRQDEQLEINIQFRQIRLPRTVKVEYPRQYRKLKENWKSRSGLLVASFQDSLIGYISLMHGIAPSTIWATDLVVKSSHRRQGIASSLILAAQTWTRQHDCDRFVLEMQSKNHPAISLVQKLGYDFSGYNDRYYLNRDIGLFFSKTVR